MGETRGGSVLAPSSYESAFDSTHVGVGGVDVREGVPHRMFYFGGDTRTPALGSRFSSLQTPLCPRGLRGES